MALLRDGERSTYFQQDGRALRFACLVLLTLVVSVAMASARDMHQLGTGGSQLTLRPDGLALTAQLPVGNVGASYSGDISASGGIAPYRYSLAQGYLPKGLTLNSSTGLVSGTPMLAGTTWGWVEVTDARRVTGLLQIHVAVGS